MLSKHYKTTTTLSKTLLFSCVSISSLYAMKTTKLTLNLSNVKKDTSMKLTPRTKETLKKNLTENNKICEKYTVNVLINFLCRGNTSAFRQRVARMPEATKLLNNKKLLKYAIPNGYKITKYILETIKESSTSFPFNLDTHFPTFFSIHRCAEKGNLKTMKLLCSFGAQIKRKNTLGELPHHYLAFHQKETEALDMAYELYSQDPALVNSQDQDGHTPLYNALLDSKFSLALTWIEFGGTMNFIPQEENLLRESLLQFPCKKLINAAHTAKFPFTENDLKTLSKSPKVKSLVNKIRKTVVHKN